MEFLTSKRFWVLVATSLTLMVNGNFTKEAVVQGLVALFVGFIAVRTIDRGAEKLGA